MTGAELIAAERQRQLDVLSRTMSHDQLHEDQELLIAALSCAERAFNLGEGEPSLDAQVFNWPWEDGNKLAKDDRLTNLIKAGALIAAEIDRIQNAQRTK